MSGRRRFRNQLGSSLFESVVAVALFGLSAAALNNLLIQHVRSQGTNNTTTAATSVGERELESLRALDYSGIASRSSTTVIGVTTYTVQTTVATDTPAAGMKSIATQVGWSEPTGAKTVSLYAIYTDVTR